MPDTIEAKQTPLSPEDIQRDYVNIKAAGQILRDCSETTARRRIKLYESGTQRRIATITEVVNGGVVKLYPRKDIEAVAAHFNIIPSVMVYERVEVPHHVAAVPHLERPSGVVSQGLANVATSGGEVVRGEYQFVPISTKLVFGTLALRVLIGGIIIYIGILILNENRAFRQEYRDSRLIERVEDDSDKYLSDTHLF